MMPPICKKGAASQTSGPLAGYRHLDDIEMLRAVSLVTPLEKELGRRLDAAIVERYASLDEIEEHKSLYCWTDEEYVSVQDDRDALDSENIQLDNENVKLNAFCIQLDKENGALRAIAALYFKRAFVPKGERNA